jgi:hypothetical protein
LENRPTHKDVIKINTVAEDKNKTQVSISSRLLFLAERSFLFLAGLFAPPSGPEGNLPLIKRRHVGLMRGKIVGASERN